MQEPLDFESYEQNSFGSDSDQNPLGFDFEGQTSIHRSPYNGDPAQLQFKKQRRPQITDRDLEFRAHSVLTDQALALKEDRHRRNSLESTGKMASGGRRTKDKRQHTQLVYKDGQAIVRDPTAFQIEQELVARHQTTCGKKRRSNWAKKEAKYKADIAGFARN